MLRKLTCASAAAALVSHSAVGTVAPVMARAVAASQRTPCVVIVRTGLPVAAPPGHAAAGSMAMQAAVAGTEASSAVGRAAAAGHGAAAHWTVRLAASSAGL